MIPTKDRVLIRSVEPEKQTKSGILIKKEKIVENTKGQIINIGPMVSTVEVGDIVLWAKTDGEKVEYKDIDYVLVREDKLVAILEDDD